MSTVTEPKTQPCFDRAPDHVLEGENMPVALFHWHSEFVYVIEPRDKPPIANLLYSHGLTDHAARHFPTAKCLAEAGYRVILFDLHGHGGQGQSLEQSLPIKKAYASSESASQVIRMLDELRQQPVFSKPFREERYRILKKTHVNEHLDQLASLAEQITLSESFGGDGLPLVLLGHSLGALICAESAWRWQSHSPAPISGLIALNPAFRPRARPGNPLETITINSFWASRSAPSWLLPVSIPRVAFKSLFNLGFPIGTAWGIPWLSEQQEESNLYERDPLTLDAVPSPYVKSIVSQMEKTDRRKTPFPHDLLTILPESDGITSVRGGLDFAQKPCAGRKSLVRLDKICAHDLMRSEGRSKAREAVTAWLENHLKG